MKRAMNAIIPARQVRTGMCEGPLGRKAGGVNTRRKSFIRRPWREILQPWRSSVADPRDMEAGSAYKRTHALGLEPV